MALDGGFIIRAAGMSGFLDTNGVTRRFNADRGITSTL